jgi:5-methylcytosine-specific restriction endonuclease McrA
VSRKRHDVDNQATEAATFIDARSYITHTGKEFRFGKDKTLLRLRCFSRDDFKCTECGKFNYSENLDMHHVKSLGRGGDDTIGNVTTLCKWGTCHHSKHVQVQFGKREEVKV